MSGRRDETIPPHAGQQEMAAPPPAAGEEELVTPVSPADAGGFPAGARLLAGGGCAFRVWAPGHERVELHVVAPAERRVAMNPTSGGYHEAVVGDVGEGTRYFFTVGGTDRPDPASRLQPLGVHGPSEVVGTAFDWHDSGWRGLPLDDYVIYELHVGTFTEEGTFDAVIPRLDALRDLGVTVIELLPIGQFPGSRNWGYDGTFVGAVQESYGGPRGLKRLVDACHVRGLALALDVVYNHLGPEGNYLAEFAPYFTDRYRTPWGLALNFDGPHSDEVRRFFVDNALQWVDEFHVDALRVDAVHAIIDHSAEPFLQDLTAAVQGRAAALGRTVCLIAESDLNDPRVIAPRGRLGLGFDTQWNDDFHHALHAILTGERAGYYAGFGKVSALADVLRRGHYFVGQYCPYRGRKHGRDPGTKDGRKFVVSAQNHDQVGNRMNGERLSALVSPAQLRLAAAAVVLSPFVPMLFMGEEYGEMAPFQYFTSHSDSELIEAVRRGRRAEFEEFAWEGEGPDPHDTETFARSRLRPDACEREEHEQLRRLYRDLLRIRRETPALHSLDIGALDAHPEDERRTLLVRRRAAEGDVLIAFNFAVESRLLAVPWEASWRPLLDSGVTRTKTGLLMPAHSFGVFASL